MNRDHVDRFCSRVCAHVRFSPDHAAITAELTAHLEDHAAALEARGFPSDVAVQQAVDAMGDPEEIGKELDKSHSPFLGWFQIWFRAAVWTLLLLSILTAAYSLLHSTSSLRLPSQAEAEIAVPAGTEDVRYTIVTDFDGYKKLQVRLEPGEQA